MRVCQFRHGGVSEAPNLTNDLLLGKGVRPGCWRPSEGSIAGHAGLDLNGPPVDAAGHALNAFESLTA